jgi:hypothetical protein
MATDSGRDDDYSGDMDTNKTGAGDERRYTLQTGGITVRYNLLTQGQQFAVSLINGDRDDDGNLTMSGVRSAIEVVEGCLGETEWAKVRRALNRGEIGAEVPIRIFVKIVERSGKEQREETPAEE